MQKNCIKNIHSYSSTFFLLLFSLIVSAQKLPNIQKESVRAPDNVKVDGKPIEWGNKLKAYNNATEISGIYPRGTVCKI